MIRRLALALAACDALAAVVVAPWFWGVPR